MEVKTLKIALLSIAALALVGLGWLLIQEESYPQLQTNDNTTKQGFIGKNVSVGLDQYEFIGLDSKDLAAIKAKNSNPKSTLKLNYTDLNQGVHYIAFDQDMTFKDVLYSLKYSESLADTKFTVSYYDADKRRQIMTHNDYFAPKGTVRIKLGEEDKYTVKAGNVITFLATEDVEIIGANNGKLPAKKLPKLCEAASGWHQIVLPSNNLTENLSAYYDTIEKVYIQRSLDDPNAFTPVPADMIQDEKVPLKLDYYIVWVRFDEPLKGCTESPTTNGITIKK